MRTAASAASVPDAVSTQVIRLCLRYLGAFSDRLLVITALRQMEHQAETYTKLEAEARMKMQLEAQRAAAAPRNFASNLPLRQ